MRSPNRHTSINKVIKSNTPNWSVTVSAMLIPKTASAKKIEKPVAFSDRQSAQYHGANIAEHEKGDDSVRDSLLGMACDHPEQGDDAKHQPDGRVEKEKRLGGNHRS